MDIIFIVVDINEAFNTSGSIKILQSIVEYSKRIPEKIIDICIIANKCDELIPNKDNDSLDFIDEEQREMYEQIVTETNKYLGDIDNINYEIVKLASEDSYIYRMYQKNPNVKLDTKFVNKFGNNEFGKTKWSTMSDKKKEIKMKEFFKELDLTASLKLTGFNDLIEYMNRNITEERQYDILTRNILLELESIPKYTINYEIDITEKYLNIIKILKQLNSVYNDFYDEEINETIVKHFNENVNQIAISQILNSVSIYSDSKAKISINIKRIGDILNTETIKSHYQQIVDRENNIIIAEINRLKGQGTIQKLLEQFIKLKQNNYQRLLEIIQSCNDVFSKCTNSLTSDIDNPDKFIHYFDTLQDKFGYSIKDTFECVKKIQIYRLYRDNLVIGLFDYTLNGIDFKKYNEDFEDYLINLKIGIHTKIRIYPCWHCNSTNKTGMTYCTRCGSSLIYTYYNSKLESHLVPLTKVQKENVMSLFNYILSLYDKIEQEDMKEEEENIKSDYSSCESDDE